MRWLLDGYYRLLKLVLTVLMMALVVPIAMQILSRYTGIIPRYIWTEEIARFCFVWIIMIGAMIAVRDGTHFDVDVLPHFNDPRLETAARLLVHATILGVGLAFLYWGYDFAQLGARQRSEIFGLPMVSIYIAWPLAGATWILFALEKIVDEIAARRETRR